MADQLDAQPVAETTGSSVDMDQTDAKGFTSAVKVSPSGDSNSQLCYKMNHSRRGLMIIINNKKFNRSTGMGERSGTDEDATALYQRFKELEFEIHLFTDQTIAQMAKIMQEAAIYDHSNSDCFMCAILSHGDNGVIYGTDGIIQLDDLLSPLKGDKCPTLAGKPKVFIIQACRGSQLDHGLEVSDAIAETDDQKVYRIPSEADILFCYSTVPGYYSWRNSSRGSWFVQALNKMMQKYGQTKDFLWILTRVNHEVAYNFESNASKEFMNKKKQIPQIVSMLTKDLYFKSKSTPV